MYCSAFSLVFVLEGTSTQKHVKSRSILWSLFFRGNDTWHHIDRNQGYNRGLGDPLSSSLLAIRSQHFIDKWIPRSQQRHAFTDIPIENNSICQKWQDANWTPTFHSFPKISESCGGLVSDSESTPQSPEIQGLQRYRLRSQPGAEVAVARGLVRLVRLVWLGPRPPSQRKNMGTEFKMTSNSHWTNIRCFNWKKK